MSVFSWCQAWKGLTQASILNTKVVAKRPRNNHFKFHL